MYQYSLYNKHIIYNDLYKKIYNPQTFKENFQKIKHFYTYYL